MRFNPEIAEIIHQSSETVGHSRKRKVCSEVAIAAATLYKDFQSYFQHQNQDDPVCYASYRELQEKYQFLGFRSVQTAVDVLDEGNLLRIAYSPEHNCFGYRPGKAVSLSDRTDHYFNPDVAKEHGLVAAVLFSYFKVRSVTLEERSRNQTLRNLHSEHKYITITTIRRALKRLTEAGLLDGTRVKPPKSSHQGGWRVSYSVSSPETLLAKAVL